MGKKQMDNAMLDYLISAQTPAPPADLNKVIEDKEVEKVIVKRRGAIIPKGCKLWEFNASGELVTEENFDEGNARTYPVFNCIALSEKRARKKYDKWFFDMEKEVILAGKYYLPNAEDNIRELTISEHPILTNRPLIPSDMYKNEEE